jgi:hypothetical protein
MQDTINFETGTVLRGGIPPSYVLDPTANKLATKQRPHQNQSCLPLLIPQVALLRQSYDKREEESERTGTGSKG